MFKLLVRGVSIRSLIMFTFLAALLSFNLLDMGGFNLDKSSDKLTCPWFELSKWFELLILGRVDTVSLSVLFIRVMLVSNVESLFYDLSLSDLNFKSSFFETGFKLLLISGKILFYWIKVWFWIPLNDIFSYWSFEFLYFSSLLEFK